MQGAESFNSLLSRGRIAESQIAQWLMSNEGWIVLPAYEIEIPSGKGPRLFSNNGELITPDMFTMKHQGKKFFNAWQEAKNKSRFTWRYTGKPPSWQTGIDLRHYLDYIKVQELTRIEVRLLFLHDSPAPSTSDLQHGSPSSCPTGLFGQRLSYLVDHEDHRDSFDKNGRSFPMVYWNERDLERLATIEQVKTLQASLWMSIKEQVVTTNNVNGNHKIQPSKNMYPKDNNKVQPPFRDL